MSIVTVHVSCSNAAISSERRFDKGLTIASLKGKLELITGAGAGYQDLRLFDADNNEICALSDNDAMLGSYPIEDYMRIHVIDTNPTKGDFDDVSKVEKFELEQDDYEKMRGTVLDFKRRNKLGRFNEELVAKREAEKQAVDDEQRKAAELIHVNDRCEVVIPGTGGPRRGTVRYVGHTDFQSGWWIGVQYDEPVGKNDGSVKGHKYFSCPDKYGAFVRPQNVTVGDFPEEDFDLSSDDEM
eukprot:m.135921 g.135921  ORF g.135921 m.135921 type:complete len:241 (+) comp9897_c0_seq1:1349-2071(+)